MRPEAVIVNIEEFGNTTAGTIPLAMETARQQGKLKKGSLVLLASVGAGFTSGATCCAGRFKTRSQVSGLRCQEKQISGLRKPWVDFASLET